VGSVVGSLLIMVSPHSILIGDVVEVNFGSPSTGANFI